MRSPHKPARNGARQIPREGGPNPLSVLLLFLALTAPAFPAETARAGEAASACYLNFGGAFGHEGLEGYSDMILPLVDTEQNILFFNPRVSLADAGQNDFSLGLGLRRMALPWLVLGGNAYVDVFESAHGGRLQQLGLGLELLGEHVDFRVNGYFALGGRDRIGEYAETSRKTEAETTSSTAVTGRETSYRTTETRSFLPSADPAKNVLSIGPDGRAATLTGDWRYDSVTETAAATRYTTTYTTTTRTTTTTKWFEKFEEGMDGWDAEIGFKIPWAVGPETRIFGGWYSYDNPFDRDVEGWKARLEIRPGPWLALDAGLFEDDRLHGSDWYVGARVQLPLSRDMSWRDFRQGLFSRRPRGLGERMRGEMTQRERMVHAAESDWEENLPRRHVKVDTRIDTRQVSWTDTAAGVERKTEVRHEENPVNAQAVVGDKHGVTRVDAGKIVTVGNGSDVLELAGTGVKITVKSQNNVSSSQSDAIATAAATDAKTVWVTDATTIYSGGVRLASSQVLTSAVHVPDAGEIRTAKLPTIRNTGSGGPAVTMTSGGSVASGTATTVHRMNVRAMGVSAIEVTGSGGDARITDSSLTADSSPTASGADGLFADVGPSINIGALSVEGSAITGGRHGVYVHARSGGGIGKVTVINDDVAISGITGRDGSGVYVHAEDAGAVGDVTVTNYGTITGANNAINHSMYGDANANHRGNGVEVYATTGATVGDVTVANYGTITGANNANNHNYYGDANASYSGNGVAVMAEKDKATTIGDVTVTNHGTIRGANNAGNHNDAGAANANHSGNGVAVIAWDYTAVGTATVTNHGMIAGENNAKNETDALPTGNNNCVDGPLADADCSGNGVMIFKTYSASMPYAEVTNSGTITGVNNAANRSPAYHTSTGYMDNPSTQSYSGNGVLIYNGYPDSNSHRGMTKAAPVVVNSGSGVIRGVWRNGNTQDYTYNSYGVTGRNEQQLIQLENTGVIEGQGSSWRDKATRFTYPAL